MKVQDVIDMAISSELDNITTKDDVTTILSYMNLGILELYKRFPLKTEEHIITLLDTKTIYTLPADFMWILTAYGEVPVNPSINVISSKVNVLPINEEDNPYSINLVGWNTVQVPVSLTGAYVSIIYVSSPTMLNTSNLNDPIPIPPQLVEALLYYIGYRASAPTDEEGEVNSYYRRFELSCLRIKEQGMFTADDMTIDKKFARGFA